MIFDDCMKDINATILIDLEGKSEEEVWRAAKYTRRKYVGQAKRAGITYEKAFSEKDLKKMYDLHMKILVEGGAVKWTYEKWRDFVKTAGDRSFFVKRRGRIVGCFILGEITEKLFGVNSEKRGIRPLVFANDKKYNKYRPNDYMYWEAIKYAQNHNYSFVDLGGWQINARGHLKNVNKFKEDWGGKIIYYELDYPVLTALRRKLIRNFGLAWQLNLFGKKFLGKIGKSAHDNLIKNAAARNRTPGSSK